ncbi:putative proline/betaine transporter [Mycolicibacterium hassiacum DSM 44199]|uniref:Putative proline/betaine transporter n=1 Tax=Mycolicibacterium hassiacum (strain DSM 44199 / CIP 105218 / JCM 12690 / 3849) TaxID=1122247 RepID=K5BI61_MYCHD|nr:putative proline/betaine transporter [Mycolicibacterium hassiacum DSM 44199]
MVRLRAVRLRRLVYLRGDLPRRRSDRHPAGPDDLRGVVPGAPAGRVRLGTARRPAGPATGAGADHPADGRRHAGCRAGTRLFGDRAVGAGADGGAADDPGLLHRRRIRRRRDLHGRVRAHPPTRHARQLPGGRHAVRVLRRRAAHARVLGGPRTAADAELGLADPVPAGGPARVDRAVPAEPAGRDPGVPRTRRRGRKGTGHGRAVPRPDRPVPRTGAAGSPAWWSRSTSSTTHC